jgi:hypothetical protein
MSSFGGGCEVSLSFDPYGYRETERAEYRTAQICLNGHTITTDVSNASASRHCSLCGSSTITACSSCRSNIRGYYYIPGVIYADNYSPPSFCHDCGSAYPWTEAKLQAARDLADELEGLDETEQDKIKRALDDIVRDTPRTELAVTRLKKLLFKARGLAVPAFRDISVNLATEAAKKLLLGS